MQVSVEVFGHESQGGVSHSIGARAAEASVPTTREDQQGVLVFEGQEQVTVAVAPPLVDCSV